MSNLVIVNRPHENVAVLTLNRPEARNAFNSSLLQALAESLTEMKTDKTIHAVVITGSEEAFGAGGDIKEMAKTSPVELWSSPRHGWWEAIHQFPKPLIAAVNGLALGGGCELSLACDIVIAGNNAQFGLPEIKLGFVPGRGGTQRLPTIVGKSAAMHMILTGEPIDAAQALRLGVVWQVYEVEETLNRAVELAQKIACKAPVAAMIAKELVQSSSGPSLERGMALERHCYEFLTGTEDAKEGMGAFLDKRKPSFSGR